MRYYMMLDRHHPRTSGTGDWVPIGETGRAEKAGPRPMERLLASSLMIEGKDISNILYERVSLPAIGSDFAEIIERVRARVATRDAAQQLSETASDGTERAP